MYFRGQLIRYLFIFLLVKVDVEKITDFQNGEVMVEN